MSITKHELPILEYDSSPSAVIQPDHERHLLSLRLPERAVFAFLGEAVDDYAKAHGAKIAGKFVSITKEYPVYTTEADGKQIALVQAPVGAPAAVQILDWLIAYGARKIISCGSCGVLEKFDENRFLIPSRALRDEGTSYHYLPPDRYVEIPETARAAIRKALKNRGLPFTEVTTWTTDGFFRETKEMVAYRKEEGCAAVEMECAALAACAHFRGATFGELLYTADTLADVERYDERDWGADSINVALELCIEAVKEL
ncbi:MAG: phosphorylase [Ruminococcaceae bacterium]|nr:phosphorylase [Oscillospiraceae bacterium]